MIQCTCCKDLFPKDCLDPWELMCWNCQEKMKRLAEQILEQHERDFFEDLYNGKP